MIIFLLVFNGLGHQDQRHTAEDYGFIPGKMGLEESGYNFTCSFMFSCGFSGKLLI